MGKATVVLVGSTGNGISLWTIDVFSYKLHRYIRGSVKEKAKVERTKVKDLGIKIRVEKAGTLTSGIKVIGINNGATKVKEKIKVVSLNMETNELQQLRIPKPSVQTKSLNNLSPRSRLCLLWKIWPREAGPTF